MGGAGATCFGPIPRPPLEAGYFPTAWGRVCFRSEGPKLVCFGGPDQIPEGLLRSFLQLAPQKEADHAAPPPGREMEVSIEPDERAAFFRRSERDVFVVVDPKRHVHDEIDPAVLRIHIAHLDRH